MKIKWKIKRDHGVYNVSTFKRKRKRKEKEKKRKNYDIKLRGSQVMLYVGQWGHVK